MTFIVGGKPRILPHRARVPLGLLLGLLTLLLTACIERRSKEGPRSEASAASSTGQARHDKKRAKDDPDTDEDDQQGGDHKDANLEHLESLGYVDGTDDESTADGVVSYKEGKTYDGYSFYNSRAESSAELIDMHGKVMHHWEKPGTGAWQHCTLLPDGDIVCSVKDQMVFRLDARSNELWRYEIRAHHDLWVDTNGEIYILARHTIKRHDLHPKWDVIEDVIQVLSPEGKLKREISLLKSIEASPYANLMPQWDGLQVHADRRANDREKSKEFDFLHMNHVEVLDGSLAKLGPLYKKGNILTSSRNMHAVMILDGTTHKILWLWGPGNLIFQHHPSPTPEGNILIFNNGTKSSGSQIVEVDPRTNQIVWTYGPKRDFFSYARGSSQRLPNGNTLITESNSGYAFEVTPQKKVVWRFANPDRKGKKRMAVWRVLRIDPKTLKFELNHGKLPEHEDKKSPSKQEAKGEK